MKPLVQGHQFFIVVLCIFLFAAQAITQTGAKGILSEKGLTEDFDMGVDTSKQKRDWLTKESDCFKMSFPADQKWAAVFITYGEPTDPPRRSIDLSAYRTLSIGMKGASGGETVEVGIKSNTQPDNGKEKKITVVLTDEWQEYPFPLERFIGNGLQDLKNLYVVTEFVYNGAKPQTVYVRNIKYLTK